MSSLDPSQIPAMTPPDGVIPNFVDAETRAPAARIVACIGLAMMLSFITLRIYIRIKMKSNFEADDCASMAS